MLGLAIRLVTATRSPPICWAMLPQMFSAATTRNFFAPFAFDEEEPHPARRKSRAQAAARPAVSSTRAPSMVWRGVAGRNDITNLRGDRGPERKRHLVMKTVFIIDCQALCVACLRTICRGPGCYTAKRRAGQRSRYARRSAHSRARRVVRCAAALARLWRARPDRVRGARLGCSSCRTTAGHAPLCCRHADVALAGMTIAVPSAACLLPCTSPLTRLSGLRNGRVVAIWHVDPLEPPPMRAEFG